MVVNAIIMLMKLTVLIIGHILVLILMPFAIAWAIIKSTIEKIRRKKALRNRE